MGGIAERQLVEPDDDVLCFSLNKEITYPGVWLHFYLHVRDLLKYRIEVINHINGIPYLEIPLKNARTASSIDHGYIVGLNKE